jgi:hypothetical protein
MKEGRHLLRFSSAPPAVELPSTSVGMGSNSLLLPSLATGVSSSVLEI